MKKFSAFVVLSLVSFLAVADAVDSPAAVSSATVDGEAAKKRDVVLIVPTHPDDLIVALGFCHLAKNVYDIHVCDFTHGERGLGQVNYTNGVCRATRMKEEEAVCASIGAKLHWLDEIDGEAYADRETCHRLADFMKELKPRAVFAHWPVDIHTDHVMAGAATIRAAFLSGTDPEIWFFGQSYQSKRWTPDVLLDVSSVWDETFRSIELYKCQNQDGGLAYRQKVIREYYGYQSRRFYDAKCEGFKAFILPMAGDRTVFSDLPQPKDYPQGHTYEGVRD